MLAGPRRGVPPGPGGYPFVGAFPMARRDPLAFFESCVRRHGDLVAMRLGARRAYLLRHPDHVKHVLQDRASIYTKGPTASRVLSLFGDSLTVIDGERWRLRRRRVQPAFPPSRHAHFASVISRAVAELLEDWETLAERSEVVDLAGEMRRLAQTIIIRACFGDLANGELRTLRHALDVAVAHVDRRLWSPLPWLDIPTSAGTRGRRAGAEIEACISRATADARCSGASSGTLLSALLDVQRAEPLGVDEIHEEIKAFLFAGHTTTAGALAWTWYLLSEHTEVRALVEQECAAVLGRRAPTPDDLPRLGHTRRVIEEALRLYPPTWLTARSPLDDDLLDGYVIPAGALVLLSPYLTHRHPKFWIDPERFDPDRFVQDRAAMRPAFSYFPFGGGPRRCIGSGFATIELQVILATVAQRFRPTVLPGARVVPVAGLTLRPGALPARILAR
ncbi:MAG TPA: cytochrome P450 [Candidatus Bathyarchaeia archaeon]|nr:cytochrome P450 [Candidatus Bathyarchaeia archaeon]